MKDIHQEPTPEREPEETLGSIAVAIARRSIYEQALAVEIFSEFAGEPPDPLDVRLQEVALTGRTALLLKYLEDPGRGINVEDVVDTVFDNEALALPADDLDEDEKNWAYATLREMTKDGMQVVVDQLNAEVTLTERFNRTYTAAQSVAHDNNVGVAEVYDDDGLYDELQRRLYNPETLAKEGLDQIDALSAAFMVQLVDAMLPGVVKLDFDKSTPQEEIDEEILELRAELSADSELQEKFEQMSGQMQQAGKAFVYRRLVQLWGEEALSQLSASTRERLPAQLNF